MKPNTQSARAFKNVAIVTGPMGLGGIATLIVRLVRALLKHEVDVALFYSGDILIGEYSPGVAIMRYADWDDASRKFKKFAGSLNPLDELLMISMDPTDAAIADWLLGHAAPPKVRHISGVFHPRAYFLDGEDRLRFAINAMILSNFDDDQTFFMNTDTLKSHSAWAHRSFSRSPVLPLVIEEKASRYAPTRSRENFSVISIGRLTPFKNYNQRIPGLVRLLRDKGVRISWDIFGYGETKAEIESLITKHGVQDDVRLCGSLDYAEISNIVSQYDAFVGMGTAALEAAMLGTPTILAVDGQGDQTYGFLQDVPFGNVGECQDEKPLISLTVFLEKLIAADTEVRIAIGRASREAALPYSALDYAGALLEIGAKSAKPSRFRSWLVGFLYREATVGRTRRTANRIVKIFRPRRQWMRVRRQKP